MSTFKIVILALALVFSSWPAYILAGIRLAKEPLFRRINYSGIMLSVQFLLAGAGLYIGTKTGSFDQKVNMTISLVLILVIGLRVFLAGIKLPQAQDESSDPADAKVTFISAIVEGIASLAIGLAIGLLSVNPFLHWIVIGVFYLIGIVIAITMASMMGNRSLRFNLAPFGGFLFLAAALKIILTLTGYGF